MEFRYQPRRIKRLALEWSAYWNLNPSSRAAERFGLIQKEIRLATSNRRHDPQIDAAIGSDDPQSTRKEDGRIRAVRADHAENIDLRLFILAQANSLHQLFIGGVLAFAVGAKRSISQRLLHAIIKLMYATLPILQPLQHALA